MGTVRTATSVLRILRVLCLYCLAASPQLVTGQRFSFRVYDREAGLSDPILTSIVQDETGFLWIATEGGVFRYDGAQFKLFPGGSGFSGIYVEALHHTPDGTLWALTREALGRKEGDRFVPVPLPGVLNVIGPNRLASDWAGVLYIAVNWDLIAVRKSLAGGYETSVVARGRADAVQADSGGNIGSPAAAKCAGWKGPGWSR
jgi:hypothetical protein